MNTTEGTQIRIKKTTAKELSEYGKHGESYNDIIEKLLERIKQIS